MNTALTNAMMTMVIALPVEAQAALIDYHEFATPAGLWHSRPVGTTSYQGTAYEYTQWISPVRQPGFGATQLIASWNARTPARTWLEIAVQAWTNTGVRTGWYVLGRWASGDTDIRRASVAGQDDANATVAVDTLQTKPGVTLRSYRLRVNLYRAVGCSESPAITGLGAMCSAIPDRFEVPRSRPGKAAGIELPVPAYAQKIHKGHFPEYGGGGENWCSPAATQMVVEYWGRRPREADMAWIPANHPDPTVDYAARYTYDYAYQGTGNWSFNTAYVAQFGLHGHITRLPSLADLEDYIRRGIPVITSQSFLASELDSAKYSTAGHLMVVIGFTTDGDVIVNDPASDSNDTVRTVYQRAQFEKGLATHQALYRYRLGGECLRRHRLSHSHHPLTPIPTNSR